MHSVAHSDASPSVHVQSITLDHPWRWLAAGWADLTARPALSLGYGAVFAAVGFLLLFGLEAVGAGYLILPMGMGFALIAPLAAVGLYEASRRRQRGDADMTFADVLGAWRRNPGQMALVGAFLLIAFLAWVRLAMLEFMLFFGAAPPPLDDLLGALLLSPQSLAFLLVGLVSGGVIAAGVFAMIAIAVPMLLDRSETDAMTAMLTSVRAVRRNWRPMLLWAGLIGSATVLGMALYFVGLVVVLPLLGHASWHAYRDLVE